MLIGLIKSKTEKASILPLIYMLHNCSDGTFYFKEVIFAMACPGSDHASLSKTSWCDVFIEPYSLHSGLMSQQSIFDFAKAESYLFQVSYQQS